ncbi:PilN domain-containing protein [uncultured Pseudoteredinibacter sp.]|uniref:PilN domain-containing protein n=1 Tax=uncultured Pseudoteredinibacter sp. TaxID=1641701 RepID=UPI002601C731|nr:PilN domain-containing protein [uncultured Pseudoteredinibacter sp.]
MKLETNNLSLFGYDLSNAFAWLRLAWRELLWDRGSPLLRAFEEPVRLYDADSLQEIGIYRGDQRLARDDRKIETRAVCLADSAVLSKSIQLPIAVEADLHEVMLLESAANSPFPEEDTVMGWRVAKRQQDSLSIDLLIAHKADARAAIASIDGAEELWARASSSLVLMEGFEENRRRQRYLGSIKKVAFKCFVILLLACVAPAMVSGFRFVQMEKVQQQFQDLKRDSASAVAARETLASANDLMDRFNVLISEHPEPSYYLQLLTQQAADDVWLRTFNLKGLKLQITGYAEDATAFIQQLSQLEQFSQVKQRGGIRRDNASGREVFTLDISLDPDFRVLEGEE